VYTWMRTHKVIMNMGEGHFTLGSRSVILKMARSISPEADNVMKRKIEKVKSMTRREYTPTRYHKYIKAFKRQYDNGILPKH